MTTSQAVHRRHVRGLQRRRGRDPRRRRTGRRRGRRVRGRARRRPRRLVDDATPDLSVFGPDIVAKARRADRPLPGVPLGAAADAAPGAVGRGLRQPGRASSSAPTSCDLSNAEVSAVARSTRCTSASRAASTWSASAPTRCARCSAATRSTRRSRSTSARRQAAQARGHRGHARASPARSPSSTPSASRPATSARCCRSTTSSTTTRRRSRRSQLVDALRRGEKPAPTRGAPLTDLRDVELQLAGFFPEDEARTGPTWTVRRRRWRRVRGAQLAADRGWTAPTMPEKAPALPGGRRRSDHSRTQLDPVTPVLTKRWLSPNSWRLDDLRAARGLHRAAQGARRHPGAARPAGQGLRPARPRRRGLPGRREVVVHAAQRGQAALPRDQRRRGRAGDLQGHPADDGGPALADRGLHHRRRTRCARTTASSTSAARRCTASAGSTRRCARPTRRATSARTSSAPASTWTSPCTPAPARTSAARRPRCSTRSRAAAASPGSSRRSRRPRASTPRRPRSTTSRPSRACRSSSTAARTGSATMGSERSPGPKIFSISGHVEKPGQYEAPLGTTLRQLLELAGGMKDGIPLKFWTPGGSSTPLFTAEHLDVPLDFEGAVEAGSMLGTTAMHGLQRDRVRAVGRDEVDRVLRARVLRQVHAVPRGHLLARRILQRMVRRPRHRGRHRHAARHLRQRARPVVLRAR